MPREIMISSNSFLRNYFGNDSRNFSGNFIWNSNSLSNWSVIPPALFHMNVLAIIWENFPVISSRISHVIYLRIEIWLLGIYFQESLRKCVEKSSAEIPLVCSETSDIFFPPGILVRIPFENFLPSVFLFINFSCNLFINIFRNSYDSFFETSFFRLEVPSTITSVFVSRICVIIFLAIYLVTFLVVFFRNCLLDSLETIQRYF